MTKNYLILTDKNEWLSTLYAIDPEKLQEEMAYVVLEMDVEEDTKVFAYEFVGEAIDFKE